MSPLSWILIAVIIAIVGFALRLALRRRMGYSPACPQCERNAVAEIKRDVVASRTVQFHNGSPAGGMDVRLQQDFEVAFRCESCGHTFSRRITQTQ